ncbi:MAG: porin, partial [bacterium]
MSRRLLSIGAVMLMAITFALPAQAQVQGSGTLKGKAYFDLVKGLSDANEDVMTFGFRRIYFTYDLKMSDDITGRFRTDIKQDPSGYLKTYMKHAYANWELNDRFSLRAGQQGTILFGTLEDIWGYRQVEKTLEDLFKVRSSADFGLSAAVKAGGTATVKGMYSNGEGYNKYDDGAFQKAMEVQGILAPIDGLTVSVHFGLNGYDEDGDPDTTGDQENTTTMDVGAGYEGDGFAVGGSFVNSSNYRFNTDQDASGFWGFGRYSLADSPISLLGAYYSFDPDTDTDDDETSYFLAGLDYTPGKGLSIIPNFRSETVGSADAENAFFLTFYW